MEDLVAESAGADGPGLAVGVVRLLADEPRLRAFAAVVLGSRTTSEVAAAAGLTTTESVRMLARLESGGLIDRDEDGWRPRPDRLRAAVSLARSTQEPPDFGNVAAETAAVLRIFLPHGRLAQMPAQRGKRRVVLDHIARVFEPGVRYRERDVNALLRAFYDDYATLRRYLVDEGFLTRAGGEYWRIGGTILV